MVLEPDSPGGLREGISDGKDKELEVREEEEGFEVADTLGNRPPSCESPVKLKAGPASAPLPRSGSCGFFGIGIDEQVWRWRANTSLCVPVVSNCPRGPDLDSCGRGTNFLANELPQSWQENGRDPRSGCATARASSRSACEWQRHGAQRAQISEADAAWPRAAEGEGGP